MAKTFQKRMLPPIAGSCEGRELQTTRHPSLLVSSCALPRIPHTVHSVTARPPLAEYQREGLWGGLVTHLAAKPLGVRSAALCGADVYLKAHRFDCESRRSVWRDDVHYQLCTDCSPTR